MPKFISASNKQTVRKMTSPLYTPRLGRTHTVYVLSDCLHRPVPVRPKTPTGHWDRSAAPLRGSALCASSITLTLLFSTLAPSHNCLSPMNFSPFFRTVPSALKELSQSTTRPAEQPSAALYTLPHCSEPVFAPREMSDSCFNE